MVVREAAKGGGGGGGKGLTTKEKELFEALKKTTKKLQMTSKLEGIFLRLPAVVTFFEVEGSGT